jgi:hypothetical protein
MSYLECLPEEFAEQADWALVLVDGTRLPVHSHFLRAISSIMAGLEREIPFKQELDVATAFFMWLYHQKFSWTLHLAKELAKLSHFYDIPGMHTHRKNTLNSNAAAVPEVLDPASFPLASNGPHKC